VFAIDGDSESIESEEDQAESGSPFKGFGQQFMNQASLGEVYLQGGRSGFMDQYMYSEEQLEQMKMQQQ